MSRAWIINNGSGFEIFYGQEPERDAVTGLYIGGHSEVIYPEYTPLSDDILKLTDKDAPVEVMLAPVDKVSVVVDDDFFITLAGKMRELWPKGDKDGKYAWREPTRELAKRLKTLWSIRNLKRFTLDDCLRACRSYLSEYEHKDTKYMQVVKYFVLKQKEVVGEHGRIRYISTSRFADILEGIQSTSLAEEFETLMYGSTLENLV